MGQQPLLRWFVLEGDWGGQVFATVPVEMIPAPARRRRIRQALTFLNSLFWPCQEGTFSSVYQEFEPWSEVFQPAAGEDSQACYDRYAQLRVAQEERLQDAQRMVPRGVVLTCTFPAAQRIWTDRDTYVRDWHPIGFVSAGMGGGYLLEGDLWLHSSVLARGVETVNRVRALLGLVPVTSLDIVWNEETRRRALFCNHFTDFHSRPRRLHLGRRRPPKG